MAEGVQLGSLWWNLGIRGTLKQDVAAAERQVDGLGKKTEVVTKRNVEQFGKMAMGVAAVGGAMVGAGVAAQSMGGDIANVAPILMGVGGALSSVSMVAMSVKPIMSGLAAVMSNELVAGCRVAISALWATNAALVALGAATVIGAVVVGMYLLYTHFSNAARAAENLKKQVNDLTTQEDFLRVGLAGVNQELKDHEELFNNIQGSVSKYQGALDQVNQRLERSKTINDDITQAEFEYQDALKNRKTAKHDDRAEADFIVKKAKEKVDSLIDEKKNLGDITKLEELRLDFVRKQDESVKSAYNEQVKINKLKEEQKEYDKQIRIMELAGKLLDWSSKGLVPSTEMWDILKRNPEMAAARKLANIEKVSGYEQVPEPKGLLKFYPGFSQARTITNLLAPELEIGKYTKENPLYKNAPPITIQNYFGTVTAADVVTINEGQSTMGDQAAAKGYTK